MPQAEDNQYGPPGGRKPRVEMYIRDMYRRPQFGRMMTPDIGLPDRLHNVATRARSTTPAPPTPGLDSSEVLADRLKHYELDFPDSKEEYLKHIYDPSSKWFSRKIKPQFKPEEHLCYQIETHQEQAQYLCHVLVNLYIGIRSLDIESSILISNKDLMDLKGEIETLVLKTDMFRLSDTGTTGMSGSSMGEEEFSEDALYNENDYINTVGNDTGIPGKITARSATIVNVNHWSNELKNCLEFDIPISLRKMLAITYYYLSLVMGQHVSRNLFIEIFELLVNDNSDGTDFTVLLRDAGLILDYKALLDILLAYLPYPDSDYVRYDLANKEDATLFKMLLKLARLSRPFFDEGDKSVLKSSMGKILSSFSPTTIGTVLPILASFTPLHYGEDIRVTDYLPFCFSLWTSVAPNPSIDTHLYDLTSTITENFYYRLLSEGDAFLNRSKRTFGEYGLLSKDQVVFLFNRVHSQLIANQQLHSFSKTFKLFVYSINGEDPSKFFQNLSRLIKSIETYAHPSNSGFWTKTIAKFIHCFVKLYHERAMKEREINVHPSSKRYCLTPSTHSRVVELFLNILFTGAQDKSQEVSNCYISSFAYLLDLNPDNKHLILDRFLEDLYDSLSDEFIDSRHRIISSLKQFTRLVRYLTEDQLYRIHITNIVSTIISKIDPNDILLTTNLINAIVSTFCFVPLAELVSDADYLAFESNCLTVVQQHYISIKEQSADKTSFDPRELSNAFRASTLEFKNILRVYIDKLQGLVDADLEDNLIHKITQTTLVLLASMDDKMFNYFADLFEKKFWENDILNSKNPNYDIIAIPLGAIVRRDPSRRGPLLDKLMFNIREQISLGAGSVRSTTEVRQRDLKLVLYLTAINNVLRFSYGTVKDYADKLIEFMKYILKDVTNPTVDIVSSMLIHSILATLTTTEIVDYRMYSSRCNIPPEERWGGLQFDDRRFQEENLDMKWFKPGTEEISTATYIFKEITEHCQGVITSLMAAPQSSAEYLDQIQKYILVLTHTLVGCSLLFDSDFNRNIHRSGAFDLQPLRERLQLIKHIRENNYGSDDVDTDTDHVSPTKSDEALIVDQSNQDDKKSEEDIIPQSECPPEELSTMEPPASDIPSGFGTPVRGGFEHKPFTSSNAASFRDIEVYKCNYAFGATLEEKQKNDDYFLVHKLRSQVGLLFHKVFVFFSERFENNPSVFQTLLHGFKVWFVDIGQDTIFVDDPTAMIEYEFIHSIQSIAHRRYPFTRTCLAVEINDCHQGRVLLHSTHRYPSKLEIQLLKDIVLMSSSIYPDIHQSAHSALVKCMKQLIGSYSVVIKQVTDLLRTSLDMQNDKKTKSLLKIVAIKKIFYKLVKDFKNLPTVVSLLIECCKLKEHETVSHADSILAELVDSFKIPSSVCVHDTRMYSLLTPSDTNISLQVDAVKAAKANKRREYMQYIDKLQNYLISTSESHDLSWRTDLFVVRLLSKLQSSLEIGTSTDAVRAVFFRSCSSHPKLVHTSIKCLLGITNKILSLSDYDYDISRSADPRFDPSFVVELDSSGAKFADEFQSELNNFDTPRFFIDARPCAGWLTWGDTIKVIKPGQYAYNFKKDETEALKSLGNLLTKEWLNRTASVLVEDNETRVVFSSSNVSFVALLLFMISRGYNTQLSFNDVFELCQQHYKTESKASMILSIEIVAGLIYASKYITEKETLKRDEFLRVFLQNCLGHDLNQDEFDIWSTLSWWLPTVVDIRRCSVFVDCFRDAGTLALTHTEYSSQQALRLSFLWHILSSLEFRCFDCSSIIDNSNLILNHPYEQVREAIAKLLATLVQNACYPSRSNREYWDLWRSGSTPVDNDNGDNNNNALGITMKSMTPTFDQFIKRAFLTVLQEYEQVRSSEMTPQEIIHSNFYYTASTLFYWIKEMAAGPNKILLIPYFKNFILPFLSALLSEREVCKLADLDPAPIFLNLAYIPVRREYFTQLLDVLCSQNVVATTSHQLRLQLGFIEFFLSAQLLQLTTEDTNLIYDFVVHQLFNPDFVEVRIRASTVLSDMVHNSGTTPQLNELIEQFNKRLSKFSSLPFREKQKISRTNIEVHASILGLGAFISAFPYTFPLPSWIPKELDILSSWARTSGMSGTAAKDIISAFKKVRADTWRFDRLRFTQDELEDLEGVLWRSYYA